VSFDFIGASIADHCIKQGDLIRIAGWAWRLFPVLVKHDEHMVSVFTEKLISPGMLAPGMFYSPSRWVLVCVAGKLPQTDKARLDVLGTCRRGNCQRSKNS